MRHTAMTCPDYFLHLLLIDGVLVAAKMFIGCNEKNMHGRYRDVGRRERSRSQWRSGCLIATANPRTLVRTPQRAFGRGLDAKPSAFIISIALGAYYAFLMN